jgi:hypothetical protein
MMFVFLSINCHKLPFGGDVKPGKRSFCRSYSNFLEKIKTNEKLKKTLNYGDAPLTIEHLNHVREVVQFSANVDPAFRQRYEIGRRLFLLSTKGVMGEIPEQLWEMFANLKHYEEALRIKHRESGIVLTNDMQFSPEVVHVKTLVAIYNFNCPFQTVQTARCQGLEYFTTTFQINSHMTIPVDPDENLVQALNESQDGMLIQEGEKPGTTVVYVRIITQESYGKEKIVRKTPFDIKKTPRSLTN